MAKAVRETPGQLPTDVARAAGAAWLGAHQETWSPRCPWRTVPYLILPGLLATRAITWLVDGGVDELLWLVALQLLASALFSVVFVVFLWSLVDPRWRRVRVFGFAGGLVRRATSGRLLVVTWDEIVHAGRELQRNGAPSGRYKIEIRYRELTPVRGAAEPARLRPRVSCATMSRTNIR